MRPSSPAPNKRRSTELGAPTTPDPNAALKDGLTEETRSRIADPGATPHDPTCSRHSYKLNHRVLGSRLRWRIIGPSETWRDRRRITPTLDMETWHVY
jgi:hypothetical protein